MKKFILFFPILIFMVLTSCSQLKLQSQWHPSPEDITVNSEEWEHIPFAYHEDPSFVTGAINNDSTVSFTMRFNDPMFARFLNSRGFTVWVDKDKFFGIDYMGTMNANQFQSSRRFSRDSTGTRKPPVFQPLGSDDFTILDQIADEYLSVSDIKNLDASLSKMDDMFCLSFSLPYKRIDSDFDTEILSGKSINIILHIKEMERPANNRGAGMSAGGQVGGMRGGGRGSGGIRGGKPGGRPGMGQSPDTGSKDYKIKVILAEKN